MITITCPSSFKSDCVCQLCFISSRDRRTDISWFLKRGMVSTLVRGGCNTAASAHWFNFVFPYTWLKVQEQTRQNEAQALVPIRVFTEQTHTDRRASISWLELTGLDFTPACRPLRTISCCNKMNIKTLRFQYMFSICCACGNQRDTHTCITRIRYQEGKVSVETQAQTLTRHNDTAPTQL